MIAKPLTSERGRILPPNLDDRTWQDLVDEMRALIPTYTDHWTDHNPSDIGMTLVELFAWLVEQLIYRLNRVPEKNYIAFLKLLGVTRDPPTPAQAFLTFTSDPALERSVTVPKGTQVQTPGKETEGPIIFETDDDLAVLPTALNAALLFPTDGTYANLTKQLTQAPTAPFILDLAKRTGGSPTQQILCLGFSRPTTAAVQLRLLLSAPINRLGGDSSAPEVRVDWLSPRTGKKPSEWTPPQSQPNSPGMMSILGTTLAASDPRFAAAQLLESGIVAFTPPTGWTAQKPDAWGPTTSPPSPAAGSEPVTVPAYWIALRFSNYQDHEVRIGLDQVLFNAVSAHHALSVTAAEPDTFRGNGLPFQRLSLRHQPLYVDSRSSDPYEHVQVQIGPDPDHLIAWTSVEDFPATGDSVYRIDPVTGEIQFGNYDERTRTGRGAVPPEGATIRVTYRYVAGGAAGNVGAGTLTSPRLKIDGITTVTNLASALDGSDEEAIEDTLRRAPELLRNRYRAVTAEDYEFLAREATTDVLRARCLAPRSHGTEASGLAGQPWLYAGIDRSPGNVNLIVVPRRGAQDARPKPSPDLLRQVQTYLERRHDLTARLLVRGPAYLPIKVKATINLFPGQDRVSGAEDELTKRVVEYLHPTRGGDGTGWEVGQSVYIPGLFQLLAPAADVGYVSELTVEAEMPDYLPTTTGIDTVTDRPYDLGPAGPFVRVLDYELVCSASDHEIVVVTDNA